MYKYNVLYSCIYYAIQSTQTNFELNSVLYNCSFSFNEDISMMNYKSKAAHVSGNILREFHNQSENLISRLFEKPFYLFFIQKIMKYYNFRMGLIIYAA